MLVAGVAYIIEAMKRATSANTEITCEKPLLSKIILIFETMPRLLYFQVTRQGYGNLGNVYCLVLLQSVQFNLVIR